MNSILSPILWSILPSQITHQILPYLTAALPQIFPPHPKGSPGYQRNFRIASTGIIAGYLCYSFLSDGAGIGDGEEDWYNLLGVGRDVDEDGLRKAFRSLSRTHHPDRAGSQNEGVFIAMRQAYEGLSDPVKRFAYDRFGPSIIHWKNNKTVRDYILTGLLHSSGFYIVSAGIMLLLAVLGRASEGAYWRNIIFVVLLLLELTLLLSPTPASIHHTNLLNLLPSVPAAIISPFIPHSLLVQTQYRQIQILHTLWTSSSIAIAQLAGIWSDEKQDDARLMADLTMLVRTVEVEAVSQFQNEIVPILSSGPTPREIERYIQAQMEQVIVDRTISSHPEVRPLWQEAMDDAHRRYVPRPRGSVSHHRRKSSVAGINELELAKLIPLPPSPPPSPIMRPVR